MRRREKQLSHDEIAGLPDEWVVIVACGAARKTKNAKRLRRGFSTRNRRLGQLLSLPY
jgi:hypothetical protein